jgi:hypothetical protein
MQGRPNATKEGHQGGPPKRAALQRVWRRPDKGMGSLQGPKDQSVKSVLATPKPTSAPWTNGTREVSAQPLGDKAPCAQADDMSDMGTAPDVQHQTSPAARARVAPHAIPLSSSPLAPPSAHARAAGSETVRLSSFWSRSRATRAARATGWEGSRAPGTRCDKALRTPID